MNKLFLKNIMGYSGSEQPVTTNVRNKFNAPSIQPIFRFSPFFHCLSIGPLQDTITWYKIRHVGTQTAHWDIQNKEDLSLSDLSRFVLDVPVRNLRSNMADFVPCDRILQRAYSRIKIVGGRGGSCLFTKI